MTLSTILLIILGVLVLWLIVTYNGLVTLRNRVKEAWSDIDVQLKIEGVRLIMQYLLTVQGQVVARAETIHCRLDQNFKVQRLETKLIQLVEKEQWIETWL